MQQNKNGIKLSKKCPRCNSTTFKPLFSPKYIDDIKIVAECRKCGYVYGMIEGKK